MYFDAILCGTFLEFGDDPTGNMTKTTTPA
jgi:hypothetical protein